MKYNHFEGRKKMKIENFKKLKFSIFKKKIKVVFQVYLFS